MHSMEDLIGATITDAHGDDWVEVTLPDGRVLTIEAETRTVRPNAYESYTMEVGILIARP